LISVDGSNGGINADVIDTNGDDHGLIDVHSDATGGLLGDTLDGTNVDIINPDSLIDAHVPGVLDATVGDGTVSNLIQGVTDGGLLGGIGDTVGGIGDTVGDAVGGVTGGAGGLGGITAEVLNGDNIAEIHAPPLLDATVGGGDLGGLLGDGGVLGGGLLGGVGDTVGDVVGGVTGGANGLGGITAEVLNGENVAEIHAPPLLDATVGGGALGSLLGGGGGLLGGDGLLGGIGNTVGDVVGGVSGATDGFQGITAEVLNGETLAEVHAPPLLDATVGGAELGNLVGGGDLGGILDGGLLGGDGGLLGGDGGLLGSVGDIAGDLTHSLDHIAG
jgi:hypothetical protein